MASWRGRTLSATFPKESYHARRWSQIGGVAVSSIISIDSNPTNVTLGPAGDYKDELLHVLAEPPISEDDLPPNVPVPEGEFPGGLQDRFQVVGLNPEGSLCWWR